MDIKKKISKFFPGKNSAEEPSSFEVLAFGRDDAFVAKFEYAATEAVCLIEALKKIGDMHFKKSDVILMNRFFEGAYQETGFAIKRSLGFFFMPIGNTEVFAYKNDKGSHFSVATTPFRVFAKKADNMLHFFICEMKGKHILTTGSVSHPIIFDEYMEEVKNFEVPRLLADALKEYRPL